MTCRRKGGALLLAMASLAGCAETGRPAAQPAPEATFVVLGAGGQAQARVITVAGTCPEITIDGVPSPMQTRAPAGVAPLRPHQAKAANFPVRVCAADLPPQARDVRVGGQSLPLPHAGAQRIVMLGDTGCRIKQAENAYQDCSDTAAWPLRAVADAAAREHPDLVVHVGDYHYRENVCPSGAGCANSPWGGGWDAWQADFFDPARSLLAAAPWVLARGNHEICARAGQGWFRLLDSAPPDAERRCDLAGSDDAADFSAPYAVPLGGNWQLIVFDSARASQPLDPARPADARALAHYRQNMETLATLAAVPGMHSIFISHHPVLGFGIDSKGAAVFGTPALLLPLQERFGPRYFPAGVDLAVHGHVHTFEAIGFATGQPATLVTGHGGDNLDAEVPRELAAHYPEAPDVRIDFAYHAAGFGYLVLDREAAGWRIRAQGIHGEVQALCTLADGRLACSGPRASTISGGAGR